jgi:intracellular multiplication protein IcmC
MRRKIVDVLTRQGVSALTWLVSEVALADTEFSDDTVTSFFSSLTDSSSTASFDQIFSNLYTSLNKVYPVLISLCYVIGAFLVVKALFMLKKHGYKTAFMSSESSITGPIVLIMVGVILMYAPGFLKIMLYTLYGSSEVQQTSAWQSENATSSSNWYSALVPMIGLIQVIGLVAFIRGWILVVKGTEGNSQPGNTSKGFIYVLGGVAAINITGTIDLVNATLGIG